MVGEALVLLIEQIIFQIHVDKDSAGKPNM